MTFLLQWVTIDPLESYWRNFPLKKLYDAADRFCARHPRFGIPDLMRWIVIGNVVVYVLMLLTMRADANALSFLYLDGSKVLRGEIWRIVTFIFVPASSSPFWLAISLYFYYWIGTSLERQWGTARFNLYYWSGVLLTAIVTIVASAISGTGYPVGGTEYVNLSMFLAFAFLFPDTQLLLFFFVPVKIKWLAWLDIAVFVIGIVQSLLAGSWLGAILPVVALLNFLVFIWPAIDAFIRRQKYRHNPQTVNFKKAVRQQQQQRGYHHKCAVCGRTDTDYPDLQFRYCSKCAGYHCFCQDHIFSHVHFTEEDQ